MRLRVHAGRRGQRVARRDRGRQRHLQPARSSCPPRRGAHRHARPDAARAGRRRSTPRRSSASTARWRRPRRSGRRSPRRPRASTRPRSTSTTRSRGTSSSRRSSPSGTRRTASTRFLSGSYGYDGLWATPTSMVSHMFLDLLGYHDVTERHARLFKAQPGHGPPAGAGVQAAPRLLQHAEDADDDRLADRPRRGAGAAQPARAADRRPAVHRPLARTDPQGRASSSRTACAITGHGGVEGVMPPAVATDTVVPDAGGLEPGVELQGADDVGAAAQAHQPPRRGRVRSVRRGLQEAVRRGVPRRRRAGAEVDRRRTASSTPSCRRTSSPRRSGTCTTTASCSTPARSCSRGPA